MTTHVGPNPDLGWRKWCAACARERWHYLNVAAGPRNGHMAYCDVCDYPSQPPRDPDNAARDAPYGPRPRPVEGMVWEELDAPPGLVAKLAAELGGPIPRRLLCGGCRSHVGVTKDFVVAAKYCSTCGAILGRVPPSPPASVACVECETPGSATEAVPICRACIDKYHPGR